MTDHAEDCALVLYPGAERVKCDCEASDPPQVAGAEVPVQAPAGPAAQITGPAAAALNAFRVAVLASKLADERKLAALAKLTEELSK